MYTFMVNLINGRTMWPKSLVPTTLLPPIHHTQVGRPIKKRMKSAGEAIDMVVNEKLSRKLKSVTCDLCGNIIHNKRTCKCQKC